MALQGDGNGIVSLPTATATGDFSIVFSAIELRNAVEIIIAQYLTNINFIACFAGGTLKARINGSDTGTVGDTAFNQVKLEISRVGSTVYTYIDDVELDTATISGTFTLDNLFAYDSGSLPYSGLASGTLSMVGFTGAGDRLYNFEGSGTTLVDTISGEDGTLSGFTTGGFTGVAGGLTITSVADNASLKKDESNQAVFTIAGDITEGTPTSIEYTLDGTTWFELDASPTTTYSGTVTVTGEQDVSVRFSDATNVTATVSKLKACITIAGWWQSNEEGRGLNEYSLTIGEGNPTPSMFKSGVTSALTDPTGLGASSTGSVIAYMAQLYSDAGIPVCFGNLAHGGTDIATWQKGGSLYPRFQEFSDAVGGISFTMCIGGETDTDAGTTQAAMESSLNAILSDLNADFGTENYLTYFPGGDGLTGDTTPIYAAFDSVIANNSLCSFGGDLRGIDIDTGVEVGNDGVHLKQDADLQASAALRYAAITSVSSILTIAATGLPDGTYRTRIFDEVTGDLLVNSDIAYSSGTASVNVTLEAGSQTTSFYIDNQLNPTAYGADNGVTV